MNYELNENELKFDYKLTKLKIRYMDEHSNE
jgi:hypothetical protein